MFRKFRFNGSVFRCTSTISVFSEIFPMHHLFPFPKFFGWMKSSYNVYLKSVAIISRHACDELICKDMLLLELSVCYADVLKSLFLKLSAGACFVAARGIIIDRLLLLSGYGSCYWSKLVSRDAWFSKICSKLTHTCKKSLIPVFRYHSWWML